MHTAYTAIEFECSNFLLTAAVRVGGHIEMTSLQVHCSDVILLIPVAAIVATRVESEKTV